VAIVPSGTPIRTLLVSDGNAYLENALALLPRLELYAVNRAGYDAALADAATAGTPYGLIVFDGLVPPAPPRIPALFVGPEADGPFGTLGGVLAAPAIGRTSPDDPLLRYVDLSSVHVGRTPTISLAAGMRPAVATTGGAPLVAVGTRDGRGIGLISFDLGDSDLPLQVAFPLLVSNLTDAVVPPAIGILPPSARLGEAASVALDPAITRVAISGAGATTPIELPVIGGSVVLPGATQVGIRELRTVPDDGSAGALLGETAVNLFAPDESDIAPGDPRRISEMGLLGDGPRTADTEARAEWFWPLALAALALLAVEWLLFHRPSRRAALRFLGRRPAPTQARTGIR
jgi:hypothetical protein